MVLEYIHTAVGVIGVIVDSNSRILLVLSKDRGWEPPMGFLEPNESLIPALHRETLEECGYEIKVSKLTGIYHCMREVPILSFCFLCEPSKLISHEIEESLAVQWVSTSRLKDFVTYKPHLLRIMDALNGSSPVILRDYVIQPFSIMKTWML